MEQYLCAGPASAIGVEAEGLVVRVIQKIGIFPDRLRVGSGYKFETSARPLVEGESGDEDFVLPIEGGDPVVSLPRRFVDETVRPGSAGQNIGAKAAGQTVIAGAAMERVAACRSIRRVIAGTAAQLVVAASAGEAIRAAITCQAVGEIASAEILDVVIGVAPGIAGTGSRLEQVCDHPGIGGQV